MAGRVVLTDVCRTAISSMGDAFSTTPVQGLEAVVIEGALNQTSTRPEQVDFVYMGCVLQAGLGRNAAHQSSIQAGIPVGTPVMTIDVVCGSRLNCANLAVWMVRSGDADIVVAGGMENVSMAPYLLKNARYGYCMNNGTTVNSMAYDVLWDAFDDYHMDITAESVAEQWRPARQELDEFAAANQQKTCAAVESGRFRDEIVPMEVKEKKETAQFDTDEGPRPKTTAEGIVKLRPAFKKDEVATAVSASGINDGAATVVVMSEEKAEKLGAKPVAYRRAGALAGVAPEIVGIGSVTITKKVLAEAGMGIENSDLIEVNKAFTAQSLTASRELSLAMPKVNVDGGAIALGHPVGAPGCRVLATLLHEMDKGDARKGLATPCVRGGVGCAAIIEWEQHKRKDERWNALHM